MRYVRNIPFVHKVKKWQTRFMIHIKMRKWMTKFKGQAILSQNLWLEKMKTIQPHNPNKYQKSNKFAKNVVRCENFVPLKFLHNFQLAKPNLSILHLWKYGFLARVWHLFSLLICQTIWIHGDAKSVSHLMFSLLDVQLTEASTCVAPVYDENILIAICFPSSSYDIREM